MNGKQARSLRKIAEANNEDKAKQKHATKIIKEGFKQFKKKRNGKI